jgi:hypothetical protein
MDYVHPLSSTEIIETEDGKKEVINSWAFASMVWSAVLRNNTNALQIAKELFNTIPNGKSKFLSLSVRSACRDEGAIREAIAILATAMDEKIGQAFENKNS